VPLQKAMCMFLPTVEVKLVFINDTAPSCGQVDTGTDELLVVFFRQENDWSEGQGKWRCWAAANEIM